MVVHQRMSETMNPEQPRIEQLGFDLGLIDENLRLTPLERLRQHDECVRQILAMQERLGVGSVHEP